MSNRFLLVAVLLFAVLYGLPSAALAQGVGAQVHVSTLGIGGDVGVQVHPRANLRAGFNLFNYSRTFDEDGITYDGKLRFRSVTANLDWYLVGPLHLSPGVLLYNGFEVSALASVPGGQTFTLGSATYQSSTAAPVNGDLAVGVNKVAPEILIGVGNLVPRNGRLNIAGFACLPPNSTGPTCVNVATNPIVQANVQAQQAKLNDDFSILRYYPVVSFGIGYRF
jgi:hypothetical protein